MREKVKEIFDSELVSLDHVFRGPNGEFLFNLSGFGTFSYDEFEYNPKSMSTIFYKNKNEIDKKR